MNKDILIIGAGGHASVLLDMLKKIGANVVAYISPEKAKNKRLFEGLRHLQNDNEIDTFNAKEVWLVNGIGSLPSHSLRKDLFYHYQKKGFHFLTVVDHSAIVSAHAVLQEGVQVFPGAIINAGATVDINTIINSGAVVEHDCIVGKHNHIAPRAVLCGGVYTENNVHIGAGASVIQSIVLKEGTLIASGAMVNRNTAKNMTVYSSRSVYKQG